MIYSIIKDKVPICGMALCSSNTIPRSALANLCWLADELVPPKIELPICKTKAADCQYRFGHFLRPAEAVEAPF